MAFGDDRSRVVIDTPDPFDEQEGDLVDQFDTAPPGSVDLGQIYDVFLDLKYGQPNVDVDASARYVSHDVVGDTTVRQKVGEDPTNVTISGICTEEEANKIDELVQYDFVEVVSSRWSGFAHVDSTTTRPQSEGGTLDKDEEWLHTFTINLTEVTEL